MIPPGTKCDYCRLYWNATCELQRKLYSARDPKELQQIYQEIQDCKKSWYHIAKAIVDTHRRSERNGNAKEADNKKA